MKDLLELADWLSLEDEVAIARVTLRRLLDRLAVEELGSEESDRLAHLVLVSTRTIARLLRDHRVISGEAADEFFAVMAEALEFLGDELGIEIKL